MVDRAYWTSPEVEAHAQTVSTMMFYMCCGAFFYDSIVSAGFDFSLLRGKRGKLRFVHLAYFGTKVTFWAYISTAFFLIWSLHEIDCNATFKALEFFMGFTVFTSSCLLAFRTYCVFQGREQKYVSFLVAFLALAMLAAWMQGVNDIESRWKGDGPHAPYADGYCIWVAISPTYWVKYVITIVFDLAILALTTIGILRSAAGSRLGATLINQGIIYFVLTFSANLLVTVLTILRLSPTMSLICAMPQSTICVLSACHLHRKLAQTHRAETANSSNHFKRDIVPKDEDAYVPPPSRWSKVPLVGRFFAGQDNILVEPLSYSRGTVPSFVSGTTAAVKTPGVETPYMKTQALRPVSDIEDQRGYFDILAQDGHEREQSELSPLRRAASIPTPHQLTFEAMLAEGPVVVEPCVAVRQMPRVTSIVRTGSPNGDASEIDHNSRWIRVDVERSVKVEDTTDTEFGR